MSITAKDLHAVLSPYLNCQRWIVAYSGGLDSQVLMCLLQQFLNTFENNHPLPLLSAVHINHGLQADAQRFQDHCTEQCQKLAIPCDVIAVKVQDCSGGVEASARQARYTAFEQYLVEGDLLLFAHHLDDQAETFLLRSLRGAGSKGLAAIPQSRSLGKACLLRPLLNVRRSDLEGFAKQQGLVWIDDETNKDLHFDRNFLRHELLPRLEKRWPGYRKSWSRAALSSGEAAELAADLAELDLQDLDAKAHRGQHYSLDIKKLQQLSDLRQKNLLRFWFQLNGFPDIEAKHFDVIRAELIDAGADAQPHFVFGDLHVRRYQGRLYAIRNWPKSVVLECLPWSAPERRLLPAGGYLEAQPVLGQGLRPMEDLSIKFRCGGERCHPQGRRQSQSLKKLLQEYQVPSWWRDRIPLIYYRGEVLVAVADYWVNEGFAVAEQETGWAIIWHF